MIENENAALYFIDRHLEEGRGDKVAFREAGVQDPRDITYSQLSQASGQVADALQQKDIRREERAAMLVLDQLEFPQIFWGCLKAGVIPIPLNTLLAAPTYDTILRDSRAACLFISAELLPVVEPILGDNPYLRQIVVIGDAPALEVANCSYESFEGFIENCTAVSALALSGDETAFWLYSSGSTGVPKGVRHVHSNLKATADTYGKQILRIAEDDVIFSVAKLFFAYGLGNAMTFPLSVGATALLFAGRPTPQSVLALAEEHQPTIFCCVPTLYASLIEQLENGIEEPRLSVSNLFLNKKNKIDPSVFAPRCCISAGEALPEDVGKRWKQIFGVDVLDGVGSTELLHIFLSNEPGNVEYGTSGIPVPGYELRLVDEDGNEVKPGVIGELLVKGPSSAEGYWNQREKTRATFEGVWTRTGDKYERNKQGRYIFSGRTDDMFKVSGIWVSPFEIEQALVSHPDVLEAAVVPFRDEEGLEKPKAFIVLKSNVSIDDPTGQLKEFIKKKIGKWKYPRKIDIVKELPKTATGKIQRFKLRKSA